MNKVIKVILVIAICISVVIMILSILLKKDKESYSDSIEKQDKEEKILINDIPLNNETNNENIEFGDIIKERNESIYYCETRSFFEKNYITKMASNGTNTERIYESDEYLSSLFFINDNLICVQHCKDEWNSKYITINLGDNKTENLFKDTEVENENIFDLKYYNDEFYFLTKYNKSDKKICYKLNKMDKDKKIYLLEENISSDYTIYNDKLYYTEYNYIKEMTLEGTDKKEIIERPSEIYNFYIKDNKIYTIEWDKIVMYDVVNKQIKILDEDSTYSNVYFGKEYFYCNINENGLFKVSYDKNENLNLTNKTAFSITYCNNSIYYLYYITENDRDIICMDEINLNTNNIKNIY